MRLRNVFILGLVAAIAALVVQRIRSSSDAVDAAVHSGATRAGNDGSQRLEPADDAQRFGAAAAADAELADRLLAETGGDADEAEPRFDAESIGPVSTEVPTTRISD